MCTADKHPAQASGPPRTNIVYVLCVHADGQIHDYAKGMPGAVGAENATAVGKTSGEP